MHRWMRTQFFLFQFTWTTFLVYWGIIFDDRGFDAARIGIAITVSLVTRSVSVVTLFPWANRYLPLGALTKILPWLSLVVGALFLPDTGYVGLIVISAVFGLLYPTQMPLLETTATVGSQRGAISYGPTRMWGSVGFIAGTAANGLISQFFGNAVLLPVFLLGLLALAVTAMLPIGDTHVAAQRSEGMASWGPLVTHKVFLVALAVAVVVQSSHAAYYAFSSLHLAREGVAPWLISLFLLIAPLAEMLGFRLSAPVADRWPLWRLMGLAIVGAAVRWTVWAAGAGVGILIATQVLHALTFAMMQVGFVQVMRRHLPASLMAPAQGLYSAIATGAATAAMTAVAGVLFESSTQLTFAVMGLWALMGLPLLVLLRRTERGSVAGGPSMPDGSDPT